MFTGNNTLNINGKESKIYELYDLGYDKYGQIVGETNKDDYYLKLGVVKSDTGVRINLECSKDQKFPIFTKDGTFIKDVSAESLHNQFVKSDYGLMRVESISMRQSKVVMYKFMNKTRNKYFYVSKILTCIK